MKTEEKIELLEAVCELLHTEGHEKVYDGSEAQIFWDARTFVMRCISRIRVHAPESEKNFKISKKNS